MRLYKRNNTWWLDVSVNGQRFRLSLDTTDKRTARALANKKIAQAEQGASGHYVQRVFVPEVVNTIQSG